jgi:ribose/xylose/arabinose/galactoside ABC-type transport system permease subunit
MPSKVRSITKILAPALALAAVWTLFALQVPEGRFATLDNQKLMLTQTAVVGTAAVGATLIIASRGLDLSVGSTIALGTMMIAWLLNLGWSPWLAALVGGVGVAAGIGGVIGLLVTGRLLPKPLPKLPLSPFIVTLGMLSIVRGLASGIGGERPIYPPSGPEGGSGFLPKLMGTSVAWLPPGVWMLLVLAIGMSLLLRRTVLGRHALAIGDNEAAARYAGVPIDRTKLLVYVIGVGCAGLAAVLQFSYLTLGDPVTASGMELSVIAACVIGGASLSGGSASVSGTLIGALLMTVVANGCTKLNLPNWIQMVITGAIIMTAVAVDQWRRTSTGPR